MGKPKRLILTNQWIDDIEHDEDYMHISDALKSITLQYNKIVKNYPDYTNIRVDFGLTAFADREENDDEYNARLRREAVEKQRNLSLEQKEKALYEKLKLKYEGKNKQT